MVAAVAFTLQGKKATHQNGVYVTEKIVYICSQRQKKKMRR